MKFVAFLSFITLLSLSGCRSDKMNPNHLTSVNVKRDLSAVSKTPASLVEATAPGNAAASGTSTAVAVIQQPAAQEKQDTGLTPPARAVRSYHIIVGSHPREELAQAAVDRLKANGYKDASVVSKDQRYRVSIANYPDKQEAFAKREELARELNQEDIWILVH